MSARRCPVCSEHLQAFWVPSRRTGEELELDRCHDCGGVWFDAGELAKASGRSVTVSAEPTDRQCPTCNVALMEATLTGGISVDSCATCRGTFLEARDMAALSSASGSRPAVAGSGFVCEQCGERKPFSEAQPTLTGMQCEACVRAKNPPLAPPEKAASASTFGRFVGWLRGER
jgi:Zn-finger nucleic acid-binding protein